MNLLDIRDIIILYQLQLLKLHYKVNKLLVPSYFTNLFGNNMHTSRYSLRNKRVNIAIPPKNCLKRNVQYQLL